MWHGGHLREEALEEYSFGRSSEPEAAAIEEHLLLCEACQESLGQVEEQIHVIRASFAAYALSPQPERARLWKKLAWRCKELWHEAPSAVLAAAAVVCVLAAGTLLWTQPSDPAPPAGVTLASYRGAEPPVLAQAPAARALDVSLDSADVADGTSCRVEVVDGAGNPVWRGTAEADAGRLRVRVADGLQTGQYWVRLHVGERMLREYSLRIE